jgi:predicted TIM-barrel fold metal-dependent hydrolase
MRRFVYSSVLLALLVGVASAQQIDADLAKYIDSVRAIDNHAHVVAPDLEHDKQYDALRCDMLPGSSLPPANFRFGPDVLAAWKALWGFEGKSEADAQSKELAEHIAAVRHAHPDPEFHDWILQHSGIDIVLANRVAMASQLSKDHFRWVPYDDALLFPLDNSKLKAANPDRKALFEMEEPILKSYLADSDLGALPPTLDDYVAKVIKPTLQRQKSAGAVAIKFEAAYLRSLDFVPTQHDAAASVYAQAMQGKLAPRVDYIWQYKLLQDYLFHEIAQEAGRLGLAIHIHTGIGCGEYFNDPGSDPMLLSSVLNDPTLRHTNFVLLHGGTPFDRHIVSLIAKPNVYVDTSVLELLFSPPELARILRPWLEIMPEHIVFGTDSGPFGPGENWEETTWLGSRNARKAIAIALTQMMNEGVITRERAKEIATGILRHNAADLYFKTH